MRILLIEDDPLLDDGLQAGLRPLYFWVDWVRDGEAVERQLRAQPWCMPTRRASSLRESCTACTAWLYGQLDMAGATRQARQRWFEAQWGRLLVCGEAFHPEVKPAGYAQGRQGRPKQSKAKQGI